MKQVLCALLLACTLSPIKSFSQTDNPEWVNVVKNNEGDVFFMRTTDIPYNVENEVKVWVKEIQPSFTLKGRIYKNVTTNYLYIFDCQDRTMELESTATYSYTGNLITSYEFNDYVKKFQDVIPGAIGEFLLNEACELFNSKN